MAIFQNKVFLVGYIGSDPDTHSFETGGMVTNASLATTRSWKKKGSDDWQEDTTWHRLVFYGTEAVKAHDQIHKGTRLGVEGYIRSRTVGEGSEKRYYTDIVVDRWINFDPKPAQDQPDSYQNYDQDTPEPKPTPEPQKPQKPLDDDDDDGLPF